MKDQKYKESILELSLILNELQKPIQILESIKWPEGTDEFIVKNNFKELPKLTYDNRPLKYDPIKKRQEFIELRAKIARDLGENDPLGSIMSRNCSQYEDVINMLLARGTKEFFNYSKKLYGSPNETMADGKSKLADLAKTMAVLLNTLDQKNLGNNFERVLSSEQVVDELKKRLGPYFSEEKIKIKLSDGILSDASAGSDYIKIKSELKFAKKDVDIFEVHEGWVHLGTTLNGQNQPYAKWLAKGPPCSTVTQEGLAVIMELFTFSMFPKRAKRLNDRLVACQMAEDGADLLEVINFFRSKGQEDFQATKNASRIFRGASLTGGAPFTKDISYLKGFVMIYNFMRVCVKEGQSDLIPFLFAGKVTLDELPLLKNFHDEGVITMPKYLPAIIKDMNGLGVWMAFSNFLNTMNLSDIVKEQNSSDINPFKKVA